MNRERNAARCYLLALVALTWAAVVVGRQFFPGWIVTVVVLLGWSFLLLLAGRDLEKKEISAEDYKKEQEEID